ncbi:ABC transporter permease [Candidatus Woesearchaeota archaeon]|nr:ABC transporter permease [Candidatus Woesearchaeota archaeon]
MIADYFFLSLKTLIHRKLRSWLTILGIIIGITAVVALISLGQGLQTAINEQFSTIGVNRVIVQAGGVSFGPPTPGVGTAKITEHDLDLIKRIDGVENAAGFILNPGKVKFNGKVQFVFAVGIPTDPEERKILGSRLDIEAGRHFKKDDTNKLIVGHNLAESDSTFGKTISIGDKVLLEDKSFTVIGVRKKLGDSANDGSVMIPIETLREIYGLEDEFSIINVEISKSKTPDEIAEAIKDDMRKDRHLKEGEEDFQVQTSAELISSFNTILNIVQAVLIGIAAISLIVGGVGIMNTMYTSVLERTKDIGIMKAVGAKDSDILLLFLIESGIIGFVGGAIGVLIGVGIGKLMEFVAFQVFGSPLVKASFPPYLIIGALVFSFLIGTISGLLPARQASKMNPVDALRYE